MDKGGGRKITNIFKDCYLHIKCFPTNSLAALMWRWYLNSDWAALQLLVESSERCWMGQEPNLHVYGKDDTQFMVYNMGGWPRKMNGKNTRESLEY